MPSNPTIKFGFERGFVNARPAGELESGELQELTGFYYKRGSDDIYAKAGRTAYNASPVESGSVMDGFYAELTAEGAASQIVAMQGTRLSRGTAALTGSFTSLNNGQSASATGLWSAFANQRYYFNNGADQLQSFGYDVINGVYRHRFPAGMVRPEIAPSVTEVASSSTGSVLTAASSVSTSGDKSFQNKDNFDDGDADTAATVEINNGGNVSRLIAGNFPGSSEVDWVILVTLESVQTNEGRGTCAVQYCNDFSGSQTWVTYETTSDAQPKRQIQIPIGDGSTSLSSANIGVRIVVTKVGDKGKFGVNAYDVRVQQQDGAANTENTVEDKLLYWFTEYDSLNGVESAASPVTPSAGPITTPIYAHAIGLPLSAMNGGTTDFRIYRSSDGGAFPLGTLVGTVKFGTDTFYDIGPFSEAASTTTYGVLELATLFYERDIPPPISDIICTYQNVLCMVPIDRPNEFVYSVPGYPESFPGDPVDSNGSKINTVRMASSRDDRIMGLVPLSTMLGVFMKGRCRRIDHLPVPSDPTFGVSPEDFATDHGLESKKGWCYVTAGQVESQSDVAYVSRDGIRITNLYQSSLITNDLDWDATVDVSALSSSILRNIPSASQLHFYFTPTAAFRTAMGWDSSTNAVMILSYGVNTEREARWRISFAPANASAAFVVHGISGKDYAFLMASGLRSTATAGVIVVDEVGTSDALYSYDSSGTIPHAFTTGEVGTENDIDTWRMLRLTLLRNGTAPETATVTITSGRDDSYNSGEWSTSVTFLAADSGAVHRPVNQGGQWTKVRYVCNTTSGTHASISRVVAAVEEMGWVV